MSRLLLLLVGLVMARAAHPDAAWAQAAPAPDSLTCSAALARALAAAPELERLRLDREIVSAQRAQAGRGPNPELALEVEDFSGVYAGPEVMLSTLTVGQRFERGGKTRARRALVEARLPLLEGERALFENDLALEVRLLFVAGLAAQARATLAEEDRRLAEELLETVRLKVRAGGTSPVEITRAEVHLRQVELEARRNEQEIELARRQLMSLMGPGAPEFARFAGALDTLDRADARGDVARAVEGAPVVTQRAAELGLREAGLASARSLGTPDLGVTLGVRHVGAADGLTFVGGVTLELPFRDRNQGGILAATLERNRLASEIEALRRHTERRLRELDFRLAAAQSAVRTLRQDILPLTDRAYDTLRESYRQGRTTYLDVFDARRQYVEARARELDQLAELNRLSAERLRLLGRLLDPAVSR